MERSSLIIDFKRKRFQDKGVGYLAVFYSIASFFVLKSWGMKFLSLEALDRKILYSSSSFEWKEPMLGTISWKCTSFCRFFLGLKNQLSWPRVIKEDEPEPKIKKWDSQLLRMNVDLIIRKQFCFRDPKGNIKMCRTSNLLPRNISILKKPKWHLHRMWSKSSLAHLQEHDLEPKIIDEDLYAKSMDPLVRNKPGEI